MAEEGHTALPDMPSSAESIALHAAGHLEIHVKECAGAIPLAAPVAQVEVETVLLITLWGRVLLDTREKGAHATRTYDLRRCLWCTCSWYMCLCVRECVCVVCVGG